MKKFKEKVFTKNKNVLRWYLCERQDVLKNRNEEWKNKAPEASDLKYKFALLNQRCDF